MDTEGVTVGADEISLTGEIGHPRTFLLRLRAEELMLRRPTSDMDSMESLESSRDTILYPHQVHAAHFAVSNPMLNGVLLADEVGLGKTIEAAMIVREAAYRGAQNILVMASRSLCQQWREELDERFGLDFQVLDSKAVSQLESQGKDAYAGFRITTYHYVNYHLGEFATTPWDLVVIDEAHKLKNPQGALHESIKGLPRSFTCLLTATPIQNYLTELWSISTLIDEQALGTEFSFREKYCEDPRGLVPKNVDELKQRLSKFGIRTLRSDVPEIRFTERIPRLFKFQPYPDERKLYEEVSEYLARPNWAFGGDAAGKYMILLVYRKLLASSSFALRNALHKLEHRLEAMLEGDAEELEPHAFGDDVAESVATAEPEEEVSEGGGVIDEAISHSIEQELEEVRGYVRLCDSITENAKGERVVEVMPELLDYGDRVLIFTQYKATQAYLAEKLQRRGYEVVIYNGDLRSHPNPDKDEREQAKRRFRDEADVMIATDAGAEGLNLQFCHIVVNYDLPWNPTRIEQRIGRCHRIGQQHDVTVVNLASTENAAETRLVELLTDKIELFDSVLGGTDEILGAVEDGIDFERRIFEIMQTARSPEEIDKAFDQLQLELDEVIEQRRADGQSLLRGGFDERLQDHLSVTEERTREALDRRTQLLRDFLLDSVGHQGSDIEMQDGVYKVYTPSQYFLESEELLDPEYRGVFARDSDLSIPQFTKRHPLVKAALDYHLKRGDRSRIKLEYTGNHSIHGMEELIESEGWWLNFKVTFSGMEIEDHLLSLAMVWNEGDDFVVSDLLSENIDRITSAPLRAGSDLPEPDVSIVNEWLNARVERLYEDIIERNASYYMERRAVLDEYYGARGDGEVLAERRHQVEETKEQIAQIDDAIDAAESSTEKMELTRERDALEEKLYELQSAMRAEQEKHYEEKRKAVKRLDELRELEMEVEVLNAAQWRVV